MKPRVHDGRLVEPEAYDVFVRCEQRPLATFSSNKGEPATCPECGTPVIAAALPYDDTEGFVFDLEPVAGGKVWLYTEHFPTGDPVDGVQRVRPRPADAPPSSPAWTLHTCQALATRRSP